MQQLRGRGELFLVKKQVIIYVVQFSREKLGMTGKLIYLCIMIEHYTTHVEKIQKPL